MKILAVLLLMALPQWLAACEEHENAKKDVRCKKVLVTDAGQEGQIVVQVVADKDNDGAVTAYAFVSMDEADGDDGRSDPRVIKIRKSVKVDKNSGWLGVSVGNISGALSDQLGTDGRGTVIINVVEGSAADEAGLEEHDVILSINGEDVGTKVNATVKLIKANKPGDEIEMLILRDGREQNVTVTLGSRADMKGHKFSWKFDMSPLAEIEEKIITRGKIMLKDADGEWIFKDLGDLKALKNLPGHLQMILPHTGTRTVVINNDGESNTVTIVINRDGGTIEVVREEDEITVTRTYADGTATEQTYASEDELRDDDEEAYDMLSKTGNTHAFVLDINGIEAFGDLDFDFDFDDLDFDFAGDFSFQFDTDEWKEHMGEWKEKLEESLSALGENAAGSMEDLHGILSTLEDEDGNLQLLKLHKLGKLFGKDGDGALRRVMHLNLGKPKYSFEVRTDGTIEAKIRKGDTEIVRLFSDEDDLMDSDSKLYDKFNLLMSEDD